jgi:hypothetical protein
VRTLTLLKTSTIGILESVWMDGRKRGPRINGLPVELFGPKWGWGKVGAGQITGGSGLSIELGRGLC